MTSEELSASISASLLERVKAHDSRAWERLVQLYGPVVYKWARQAGLEPNSASDIVQETFRSVLTGVGDFHREASGSTFGGWLRTIANNKMRDRARRQAAQGKAAGGSTAHQQMMEIPDVMELTDATAASVLGLARRAVELVKEEFESKTWQAFWQTTVDDRRADLVAEELGMTVGAVYTAKSRVLRRLREELAAEF